MFCQNIDNLCLVGNGYWGKIINKTFDNKIQHLFDIDHLKCNSLSNLIQKNNIKNVIIATPSTTHFSFVKEALNSNCNVFCEKPCVFNISDLDELYNLANKNSKKLHIDWIYCYNNNIKLIKDIIQNKKYGELNKIILNRMNLGPARTDVTALWDLACHDMSILSYLIDNITNLNFSKNNIENHTYCVNSNNTSINVNINVSWNFPEKNRLSIFVFDSGIILWNDLDNTLNCNGKILKNNFEKMPLYNSLNAFMNNDINVVNTFSYDIAFNVITILERLSK